MSKKTLIFDFDGTLADTQKYLVHISNTLSEEFRFNKIKENEVDLLQNMTSKEVCTYLRVPMIKLPLILKRAKDEYFKNLSQVKPIPGWDIVLKELKIFGHHVGIFSSNAQHNINNFLKSHDLNVFDFIRTSSKVWGKNIGLKRLLRDHQYNKENIFYIGDETRDIEAAQKVGIKCIAVSWGYNSAELLNRFQPDHLIHKPEEILDIL